MPEFNPSSQVLFNDSDLWSKIETGTPETPIVDPPAPPAPPVLGDKTPTPEKKEDLLPNMDEFSLGEEKPIGDEEKPVDPDLPVEEEKEGSVNAFKVINKLIADGELLGFEDDKPVRTVKDVKFILQNQAEIHRQEGAALNQQQLTEALPVEGRMVLDYLLNGGTDLREHVLKPLFEYKEIDNIDTTTEFGKEQVIRQAYAEILGMESAQIEEEIKILKDTKLLDQKSEFFKGKLKEAREKQLTATQQQTALRKQQEDQQFQLEQDERNKQLNKIFSSDKIGDVPIDNKTKKALINTFTARYDSRVTNQPIDFIQAAVEHFTKVEPNYEMITRLHWFLLDMEGYHQSIRKEVSKDVDSEYRRQALNLPNKGNKILKRPH